jgi:hypothetical protein
MTVEVSTEHVSAERSDASPERSGVTAELALELIVSIIAVRDNEPVVLVAKDPRLARASVLPWGRFLPSVHTGLEAGMRQCVRETAGLELGYMEQLCTFGGQSGCGNGAASGRGSIATGYLALVLASEQIASPACAWRSIYDYFPWEDWRHKRPAVLTRDIEPRLRAWAGSQATDGSSLRDRRERVAICFGLDGSRWDDERVLERFELLCEAGAIADSTAAPNDMLDADHCRILAAAIGRLRGKLRYRPVVFELMQSEFTLFDLQRTVEAILGPHLHKQNFRRLVESVGLVEPTGEVRTHTGGRPARLYRFRREVLLERAAPGVRVKAVARG